MDNCYLDHAATSFPKAPGVAEAMSAYLCHNGVNINRGVYRQATDAAMTVLRTRELLAELLHFPGRPDHVVFVPSATFGLNMLLRGYLRPGDHAIVSSMEHNAVMRPLTDLSRAGVSFSRIPADAEGRSDLKAIDSLLRPDTRLILVSHASNVCGSIFPLAEMAAFCQQRGIPLAVDAAQTAGRLPIDFSGLNLAALCVPAHKGLLGPQGLGAVLLDEGFAAELQPLISGGTGSASDSEQQPGYMPDKFESGTLNLPGIFGFHAALSFIARQGIEAIRGQELALIRRFLAGVEGLPVKLAGARDPEQQVGVFSVDLPFMDNAEAALRLEEEFGILTRCGLHCAPNAHKTLNTFPQGTVRFSIGYGSTEQDIDRAVAALAALCRGRV